MDKKEKVYIVLIKSKTMDEILAVYKDKENAEKYIETCCIRAAWSSVASILEMDLN